MNSITIIGRLGQDPELKYTAAGKAVCNLSVAVDRRQKGETDWFRVTAWEKQAELASEFLQKGRQVAIRGRMQSRQYEKDGQKLTAWDLVAEEIQFIGGRDEAPAQQQAPRQQQRQPAAAGNGQRSGRQVTQQVYAPPDDGLGMDWDNEQPPF